MANWHYYDENGTRIGPIRGRQIIELVTEGIITPETFVEDENGSLAPAKTVQNLTFPKPETPPSKPMPPVEPNPFTVPLPGVENPLITAMPTPSTVPVSMVKRPKSQRDFASAVKKISPAQWVAAVGIVTLFAVAVTIVWKIFFAP